MGKTGRNDPCPCGSGKKYKRCCWLVENIEPATDIRVVDEAVTGRLLAWVHREHGDRVRAMEPWLPEALWTDDEAATLAAMLLAYETYATSGWPICLELPESLLRAWSPRERRWLDEQRASWFSVWDVLEVRRDEGLFLRDVLTGEERFVREGRATHYVHDREMLLARVVRLDATWTLAATHPYHLLPAAGEAVAAEARRMLKLGRGKVDPTRLRGEAAFRLAALWDEEVRAGLNAPPPTLQNTDGQPLVLTEDVYEFDPAQRDALLECLRRLPDLEEEDAPGPATSIQAFTVWASAEGVLEGTRIAGVAVDEGTLVVDANSTHRADAMRLRVEEGLGGLARFVSREETDPVALLGRSDVEARAPAAPEIPPEVGARLIREFKTKHYAAWPDIPVPALGNMTPREAARDKRRKVYRDLDLLLREFERSEAPSHSNSATTWAFFAASWTCRDPAAPRAPPAGSARAHPDGICSTDELQRSSARQLDRHLRRHQLA